MTSRRGVWRSLAKVLGDAGGDGFLEGDRERLASLASSRAPLAEGPSRLLLCVVGLGLSLDEGFGLDDGFGFGLGLDDGFELGSGFGFGLGLYGFELNSGFRLRLG